MRSAPRDPAFVADPYPVYRELREEHPVLYDEATDRWLVARYADVNAALRDRRLGAPTCTRRRTPRWAGRRIPRGTNRSGI